MLTRKNSRKSVSNMAMLVCLCILQVIVICSHASQSEGQTFDEFYLGCFNDRVNDRVLDKESQLISDNMTIETCVDYCIASNNAEYFYAGLEFGEECYCGVAGTNYSRLGNPENMQAGCQYPCAGDSTTLCGGQAEIAVYDLTIFRLTVSTDKLSSSQAEPTSSGEATEQKEDTFSVSTTPDPALLSTDNDVDSSTTFVSSSAPLTGDKGNTALYAGAGAGGGFLVLVIIGIIIFVVMWKRRNTKERPPTTDQPLTSMTASKDSKGAFSGPADEKGGPCYENNGAELERDYQNMNELDKREYVSFPEVMDNKEISYMNTQNKSSLEQAAPDPAALYDMPDLSAKSTLSRPMTCTSPDKAGDLSLMYAVPDKGAKTVYSSEGKPLLGQNNVDALYATSTKKRLEPIGMEAPTVETDMYAMPDRSRRGSVDNTAMIENDIYSST